MGLSLRKAAKELGISHVALLKAARSGRVTPESDGTYVVDTCRRQLAENTTAAKRRKRPQAPTKTVSAVVAEVVTADDAPASGNRTLAEAERLLKWEGVRKQRFENSVREGNLVPVGEINAWVAGMIIRAREILTRIGPELKDRLAQETNPHQCERLVMGEVNRALGELAEFKPAHNE